MTSEPMVNRHVALLESKLPFITIVDPNPTFVVSNPCTTGIGVLTYVIFIGAGYVTPSFVTANCIVPTVILFDGNMHCILVLLI
jgi:hypothetical protein